MFLLLIKKKSFILPLIISVCKAALRIISAPNRACLRRCFVLHERLVERVVGKIPAVTPSVTTIDIAINASHAFALLTRFCGWALSGGSNYT